MASKYIKTALLLVIIGALMGTVYVRREQFARGAVNLWRLVYPFQPCTQTITYSINTFDSGFNLTKPQFEKLLVQAANSWEAVLGRDLFSLRESAGELEINLIYDYRQKVTSQLDVLGDSIQEYRTQYENLKAQYDRLHSQYNQMKTALESQSQIFMVSKNSYDEQVQYWNERGGATKSVYDKLEQTRIDLNREASRLNQEKIAFNKLVSDLNTTADALNKLTSKLNINVRNYNTIGSQTGEEFDEGEYISDSAGERINIYQFNDENQLIRVLEHEFGHALGLDHVSDPRAIMYRLNQETSTKLTPSDMTELFKVCKIEPPAIP